MFAAVVMSAATAEGAYLPACVSLRSPCLPRRSAAVLLQASNFDGLIDELLAAPEEQVLSVMGQRLETIADSGFMAQLERRRAAAGSAAEEQALELLGRVLAWLVAGLWALELEIWSPHGCRPWSCWPGC